MQARKLMQASLVLLQPHPRTPSVPELSLIEEQPTVSSSKKVYNPRIYQEMTSIAESRMDESVEYGNRVNQGDSKSNQEQVQRQWAAESWNLGTAQVSSENLSKHNKGSESPGTFTRSSAPKEVAEIFEKDALETSMPNTTTGEVRSQCRPEGDLNPLKPVVTNTAPGHNEHNKSAGRAEKGLDTMSKIAEHEKQLMELQEQVLHMIF